MLQVFLPGRIGSGRRREPKGWATVQYARRSQRCSQKTIKAQCGALGRTEHALREIVRSAWKGARRLFQPVHDATPGQVVRGELDPHAITLQDADEVPAR